MTGLSRLPGGTEPERAHLACDLVGAERAVAAVRGAAPDVVIHAQALSDVDRCELEPQAARTQNVDTTAHVVGALEALPSCGLVYVSTDYVFDGAKGSPYDEEDEPHPLGVYGSTKLAAERLVLGRPRSVVVRTSTLFGSGRMNFCDHLVAQLRAGAPVEAFTDQVTSPTYAEDLAEGIRDLATLLGASWQPAWPQVFHVANAGGATRVAFATRVADLIGGSRALIRPILMAAQHRPAPRPHYSALSTTRLAGVIGRTLRPWDDALSAYLRERHLLG